MTSDVVRVGQKLKIPAEKKQTKVDAAKKDKPVAKPAVEKKASTAADKPAAEKQTVAAPVVDKPADDKPADEAPVADSKPAEEKPVVEKPTTATYVVQEGDDMTGVSIRWGVSAAEIRELNNFGENDQLKPGQIIKLPAEAQQ